MCKPETNPITEFVALTSGLKHFCFDIETGNASTEDVSEKAQEAKIPAKAKTPDEIRAAKIEAYQKAVEKSALLDRAPITVLAAGFWFFTLYGLPPRVDKLEQTVAEHERRLTESGVKIDIILDDVKTIKGFILQRHGGE